MAQVTVLFSSLALAALLSFVPATGPVVSEGRPVGTWTLDPARSMVQFTVTKLGFADVPGVFKDFRGVVRFDARHPENSSIEWTVRVASVQTDAANRDATLQAREYFDAARYPELTFRSTGVRPLDAGRLQVDGEITIKGSTRPLIIVAEPVAGGFECRFELDRYDFGIVGGRVMSRLIGRTVRIHLVAIAEQEDL